MPSKNNRRRNRRSPAQLFIDRRLLHKAAVDAVTFQVAGQAFLTAGAEILQEDHNFTQEQLEQWVLKTIARARKNVLPDESPTQ